MSISSITTESGSTSASASPTAVKTKRYHPLLVTLHWLIAILILGAVLLVQENEGGRERVRPGQGNFPQQGQGFQQNNPQQNSNSDEAPQGLPQGGFPQGGFLQARNFSAFSTTGIHMILGVTILVLLIARLIVRWTTEHPDWASTGNKFFDWVGNLTHLGLYVLTFAMIITGIILADQRGILARTFGVGSTPIPGSFRRGGFSLGFFHGGVWTVLLLLIALHVGAALYHQFFIKDNLLARMWFGKRTE